MTRHNTARGARGGPTKRSSRTATSNIAPPPKLRQATLLEFGHNFTTAPAILMGKVISDLQGDGKKAETARVRLEANEVALAGARVGGAAQTEKGRRNRYTEHQKMEFIRRLEEGEAICQKGEDPDKQPGRDLILRWRRDEGAARSKAILKTQEIGGGFVDFDRAAFHSDARETNSGWRLPGAVFDVVADRFLFLRDHGVAMTKFRISALARKAYEEFKEQEVDGKEAKSVVDFHASDKWTRRFVKKMELTYRRGTAGRNKIASESEREMEKRLYWARLAYVTRTERIPPELCFHADETGLMILPSSDYTLAKKGTPTVRIDYSDSKAQVTLMVGGNATGESLAPYVIFPKVRALPSGAGTATNVQVASSATHWMDDDAFKGWIERVLVPKANEIKEWHGWGKDSNILLSVDVCASHRSKQTLDMLAATHPSIKLVYVPTNMTDELQNHYKYAVEARREGRLWRSRSRNNAVAEDDTAQVVNTKKAQPSPNPRRARS